MITDHSPSAPVLMSNALEFRTMRKSDCPPPRADEVDRTRIRSKVGRRLGLPVVLISAPAGYGKSVLAAQLARHNPLPSVWLSLTESDNDPVHLVRSLVMGLDRIKPADQKPVEALRIPAQHNRESLLPELLRCIQRAAPFAMVIDDLHAVTAPQSVAVVRYLVENLPAGCQIVLASRTDPDIGLARLRLSGELLEIRADLLALDIEETAQLLDRAGLDLDEKAAGPAALSHGGVAGRDWHDRTVTARGRRRSQSGAGILGALAVYCRLLLRGSPVPADQGTPPVPHRNLCGRSVLRAALRHAPGPAGIRCRSSRT